MPALQGTAFCRSARSNLRSQRSPRAFANAAGDCLDISAHFERRALVFMGKLCNLLCCSKLNPALFDRTPQL